jgi:two-component system NarL family sensor kinase
VVGASKVARDISQQREAEAALREAQMSSRLLQVQDDERRRIARELHDGVGQLLVAIGMNVAQVLREKSALTPAAARCVEENSDLIGQASAEIRTMAYLLHPPMLEEVGLRSALVLYIDGFSERSKINVETELAVDLGKLPKDYELSLFRITQECLTNIHRHSGSSTALVRLCRKGDEIELEVKDSGSGIKQEIQSSIASKTSIGVGFRGMRERIELLGGKLRVHSSATGTSVFVGLPLTEKV